jgi:hypothetical protein
MDQRVHCLPPANESVALDGAARIETGCAHDRRPPEQAQRIQELQTRMTAARKELRQVQHDLRRDVELLGTRILVLNAVVWPLAVAIMALAWYMVRGRTSRREAVQ